MKVSQDLLVTWAVPPQTHSGAGALSSDPTPKEVIMSIQSLPWKESSRVAMMSCVCDRKKEL